LARLATNKALPSRPFWWTSTRGYHITSIEMDKVNTTERLAELRKLMTDNNVDIYSKENDSIRFI
jgi:hypothetical protein